MAIAFNQLANMSTSTSNVSSYAGTAGTPVAGDLLICFVYATATTAAGTMTGTWTWTKLTSITSSGHTLYVFWAYASAATSTTPTFDCTGDNAASCEIYCIRVTGSSGIMVPDIQQMKVAAGTGTTNPSLTMPGAILTGNGCLSMVAERGTASPVFTAPTNWGADVEAGTGTAPSHSAAVSTRVSGETASTITWTCATTDPWNLVVIELNVLGGKQRQPGGGACSSPMTY